MKKNSLFYMANLYPEIGRIFSFFDSNKLEAANNAKIRALDIVDKILSFRDIKPAEREEWSVIKNFILGYDKLDEYERDILEKYAEPFSYKFMNSYSKVLQNIRMRTETKTCQNCKKEFTIEKCYQQEVY